MQFDSALLEHTVILNYLVTHSGTTIGCNRQKIMNCHDYCHVNFDL